MKTITQSSMPVISGTPDLKPRSGVAMIIVLSLMAALAFLGFFFFAYTMSELDSANWFFSSSNDPTSRTNMNPQLSSSQDPSDIYFDWVMEQVLVGTRQEYTNSALYGNKYSLMANMLGQINGDLTISDLHPFNGGGIKILYQDLDNDGIPDIAPNGFVAGLGFDYNNNGVVDSSEAVVINQSRGAMGWGSAVTYPTSLPAMSYAPDADYTYPDINNMFLAHSSFVPTSATTASPTWTPSFHRPQYLEAWRLDGLPISAPIRDQNPWRDDDNTIDGINYGPSQHTTLNLVLRPHRQQRITKWNSSTNSVDLYVAPVDTVGNVLQRGRFDYEQPYLNLATSFPRETLWKQYSSQSFSPSSCDYDIDADGDGVKEAIYLDLDFPPTPWIDTLDANGSSKYGRKYFIPMFGVTILDADGLINLNTSGNTNGLPRDAALADVVANTLRLDRTTTPTITLNHTNFLSRSHEGYTPFEVNLGRALYADPQLFASSADDEYQFDRIPALEKIVKPYEGMLLQNWDIAQSPLVDVFTPPTPLRDTLFETAGDNTDDFLPTTLEMANLDLFRLIHGAPNQYGFSTFAPTQYSNGTIRGRFSGNDIMSANLLSMPGANGIDDNGDALADMGIPTTDSYVGGGQGYLATRWHSLNVPPIAIPYDILGIGNVLDSSDLTNGAKRLLGSPTLNEFQWPAFEGRWLKLGGTSSGVTPFTDVDLSADLFEGFMDPRASTGAYDPFIDDLGEFVVEPEFADYCNDSIFTVSEMESLHLSESDYLKTSLGKKSRLRELAPFNFRDHYDSRHIRKQFTTDSWSRREYTISPLPATTDIDRAWEYNDTYSATAMEITSAPLAFPPISMTPVILPYSDEDPFRPALRKILTNFLGNNQHITSSEALQRKLQLGYIVDDRDPALDFDFIGGTPEPLNVSPYFRPLTPHPVFFYEDLDNDGVLDPGEDTNGNLALDIDAGFVLQSLIHDHSATVPYDPILMEGTNTDARVAQEWWARYDRQRLARDVYVLLYMLGAPEEFDGTPFNPTTTPYPTTPPAQYDINNNGVNDMVEKMAQFAVNFVDSIDQDECITRFEYDADLSDGWQFDLAQLNDGNAGTLADNNNNLVYGVEAQSLTFSEAQWIFLLNKDSSPGNNEYTFDNENEDKHYLFVELRNALPKEIDLRNGSWRIRRLNVYKDNDSASANFVEERRLYFADTNTTNDLGRNDLVTPGGIFTVGNHNSMENDGVNTIPAAFRARYDATNPTQYKLVSPVRTWNNAADAPPVAQGEVTTPITHLDLSFGNYSTIDDLSFGSQFVISNPQNSNSLATAQSPDVKGELFDPDNGFFGNVSDATTGEEEVTFVLERRQNLNHAYNPADRSNDTNGGNIADYGDGNLGWVVANRAWNEWVEVDRIFVKRGIVDMSSDPTDADTMQAKLERVNSKERSQPLHASSGLAPAASDGERLHANAATAGVTAPAGQANTIGSNNSNLPASGVFTLWQPHFDRPMTSAMEMMSVPLFGPKPLTEPMTSNWIGGVSHALAGPDSETGATNPENLSELNIASRWFMNPQGIDQNGDNNFLTRYDVHSNRWYRILEFFEVEPQIHKLQADSGLLKSPRTPGKINLNTIRSTQPNDSFSTTAQHPQAGYLASLASLLDDPYHFSPDYTAQNSPSTPPSAFNLIDDLSGEGGRDWAAQFRISRDGIDPITALPLPGGIGSRPFRSLSYVDSTPFTGSGEYSPTNRSLQSTILRKLTNHDATTYPAAFQTGNVVENTDFTTMPLEDRRQLFEARPRADVGLDNVDYHTRNRLLSKIHNNSTNVSNVFYIYVGVEFFEAEEQVATGSGFWQIGRKLTEADDPQFKMRRGFFVVDRSLLEKAYDPTTGRIDFRKLILHRRKLAPYN